MNTEFITILAWIFGVLSTLLVILRIVGFIYYNHTDAGRLDRLSDALSGVRGTFPILFPSIIAIICWVWIYTSYVKA